MAINNQPRTMAHREAMRRFGKRSVIDNLIKKTFREFDKRSIALKKWTDFVRVNLEKHRDKINEQMELDGTVLRSLVLVHQNGKEKVYISVRITMRIDSRGEMGIALIREFMDEYHNAQRDQIRDENIILMVELLKDMFVQRRKELIVTQGLLNFIRLDRNKIRDKRLKEAYDILKEAISSQESGPVVKLYTRPDKKWIPYHTFPQEAV
jgi:hypothetical protein